MSNPTERVDLKPCPKCGGPTKMEADIDLKGWHECIPSLWVCTRTDELVVDCPGERRIKERRATWNQRTGEPEPVGEIVFEPVTGERHGALYGAMGENDDQLPHGAKLYLAPPTVEPLGEGKLEGWIEKTQDFIDSGELLARTSCGKYAAWDLLNDLLTVLMIQSALSAPSEGEPDRREERVNLYRDSDPQKLFVSPQPEVKWIGGHPAPPSQGEKEQ